MATIEKLQIPDPVIAEAMRLASTHEPKEAVLAALRDYTRPRTQKELLKLLGTSDGFFTDEELEQMRNLDA